jgi:hypothetical protein
MAHAEIERMRVAANTALLVIDVQRAIDESRLVERRAAQQSQMPW